MKYPFLRRSIVIRMLPTIDRYKVSLVARGKRKSKQTEKGFTQVFLNGNSLDALATKNSSWLEHRENFISRHLKGSGKMWKKNGYPTRKHLALISWGYSPTPQAVTSFLNAIGSKNRKIKPFVKM